ncbi:hypothetical protein PtB15_3B145 [Puccinia triticina]|nr:hypothetical protein PtB15_3B145 [Puccinia triticina]
MRNIVDLPWHLFELIVEDVTQRDWRMPLNSNRTTIRDLRLVCRQWADWLYVHHLYRTLAFSDAPRAIGFINHIANRPAQLLRARCQHLHIFNILTWGDPAPINNRGLPRAMKRIPGEEITAEILGTLIELFSGSIVKLNLRFWNILSLPTQVVQSIGQIENLCELQLGHELQIPSTRPRQLDALLGLDDDDQDDDHHAQLFALAHMMQDDDDNPSPPTDMDPVESKIDHDCLKSLLVVSRKLDSLDLTDLDPINLPQPIIESRTFSGHQIPTITRLEAGLDGESVSRLIELSVFLKQTLRVLSLSQRWQGDYSEKLVPVFENLRENLEGLFINDAKFLGPQVLQLHFPRLRVFKTVFWNGPLGNLLDQPMFSSAPLDLLALQASFCEQQSTSDDPRLNPFSNLHILRRLVFCDIPSDWECPATYLDLCRAKNIIPVHLTPEDSENISLIMSL